MSASVAPDPINSTQFIPGSNTPANGGQLFFYVAGSSTKQTVYQDSAASVAWSNPLVLDSGGNLPSGGVVWFPDSQTFKVVFAPSTDSDPPTSPYWTKDNLTGAGGGSSAASEWVTGPTPTFISATSFSVAGDQTAIFNTGRRVKTANTAGTIYSTVVGAVFSSVTTITVVNDSGSIDSGLSTLFYGLISADHPSIPYRLDCLVPRTTVNATSNVVIRNVISSTYPKYFVEVYDWKPQLDAVDGWLRVSTNNAATFETTTNAYAYTRDGTVNSSSFAAGAPSAGQVVMVGSLSSTAPFPFSLRIDLNNPSEVTRYKTIRWYGSYTTNAGAYADLRGSGFFTVSSPYSAIQLLCSSSNVSTMSYAVFGERA